MKRELESTKKMRTHFEGVFSPTVLVLLMSSLRGRCTDFIPFRADTTFSYIGKAIIMR
jgi:hypothetical protein